MYTWRCVNEYSIEQVTPSKTGLIEQIGWGFVGGVICALVWVSSYYFFIRPNLDTKTVQISEKIRNQLGLWTRITSGGIVEEILFRWGALSLVMWGLHFIIASTMIVFWISLIASGILFGHILRVLVLGIWTHIGIYRSYLISSQMVSNG